MAPKTRIVLIICATVVAVALLVVALLSGTAIDLEAIVGAVMSGAVGLLAGLGLRPKPPVALLALLVVGSSACAPCVAEQAVVSAFDVGISAAGETVGDDGGEEWNQALGIAELALIAGRAGVGACEMVRDGADWQEWVGEALEAAMAVAAHFGGAGPGDVPETPPSELTEAITALQGEIVESGEQK